MVDEVRRWLGGVRLWVVVAAFAVGVAVSMAGAPRFTPDGWHYGRMMLVDAGVSERGATVTMDQLYRGVTLRSPARVRRLFEDDRPATFVAARRIFAPRVLYPSLASMLYPSRGMTALVDVSLAAYVLAAVGVFVAACAFARPLVAALAAIGFALEPTIRMLARSALADMTAIALWVVLLAVLVHASHLRSRRVSLVAIAAATVALLLARPLAHLPAAAAMLGSMFGERERVTRMRAALVAIAALTGAYAALTSLLHAPGIVDSILWLRARSIEVGTASAAQAPGAWYLAALAATARAAFAHAVQTVVPLVAIAALVAEFRRPGVAVLLGAYAGGAAALALDPDPSDVGRTFFAPLAPVIAVALGVAVEAVLRAAVERRGALPARG